ncbi:MAG: hydrolase [Actinobacteria bacterium]|nr:MAG: hydrolase [Actinomycetota bacterium]
MSESEDPTPEPFEEFLRQFLGDAAGDEAARAMRAQGFDPSQLGSLGSSAEMNAMARQLHFLMNTSTGPVNWSIAKDLATQQAFRSGDSPVTAAEAARLQQAMTIADLWLDTTTDFAPGAVTRETWTRVEWINSTLDTWKRICEPVASNMSRALSDSLADQMGALGDNDRAIPSMPEGVSELMGAAQSIVPKIASMLFAQQIGQALAGLATESFGSTDVGLPLVHSTVTALVPRNIEAFAEGLDIPYDEVTQFLAVRECAHQRLFASVPWLAGDLIHAVESYSGAIAIDTDAVAEATRSLDLSDPTEAHIELSGDFFASSDSPRQRAALERLETLLALVEGWVEVVTVQAATPYLPHCDQLREMMRRRRAAGGPAEQMLASLIGLKMRPRRARGAAQLFAAVEDERGREGRDALWEHPDMIPTPSDLDEPDSYLMLREAASDGDTAFNEELEQLFEGTLGWAEGVPGSPDDEPEDNAPEGTTS